MADAVTATILHDGPSTAVVHLTSISDGTGEAAVTKVDVSALSSISSGVACGSVSIERITYACSGMAVRLLWDATTDVLAVVLPADQAGCLDYCEIGGLVNTSGSGRTGDLQLTTVGHSSGDAYSITLKLRKRA